MSSRKKSVVELSLAVPLVDHSTFWVLNRTIENHILVTYERNVSTVDTFNTEAKQLSESETLFTPGIMMRLGWSDHMVRLLNLSLTSDLVPDQDVIGVIIHVSHNPIRRHLALRYFREKWDILNSRYGEALFMNSKLISGVTEFLNTEAELNELILTSGGGVSPAFTQAVEIIQANVKCHTLYQQQFYQWLRNAPDS